MMRILALLLLSSTILHAQAIPRIEAAARAETLDDESTITALTNAVLDMPWAFRIPEGARANLAQLLTESEIAYREGARPPAEEGGVVAAVNELMMGLGAQDGTTTQAEVRTVRMKLAVLLPQFAGAGMTDRYTNAIVPTMSPLQGFYLLGTVLTQKLMKDDGGVLRAQVAGNAAPMLLADAQALLWKVVVDAISQVPRFVPPPPPQRRGMFGRRP